MKRFILRRVWPKVQGRLDPLIVAKHLETLVGKEGGVPLEILRRTKDEEVNKKAFSDVIAAMKSSGVSFSKGYS